VTLSEIQQAQVTKRLAAFCESRVPASVRSKVRLGFRIKGSEVVLFEERPAFQAPHEWRESACTASIGTCAGMPTWPCRKRRRSKRSPLILLASSGDEGKASAG